VAAAARDGMKIAILVAVLGEHDAIGSDVRGMAKALRRLGHDVRIFASASAGQPEAEAIATLEPLLADPQALLIYHFAFGWPPALDILKRARCRRVVRYHNITPPEFFTGWSAQYETSCAAGRSEIITLAALDCELYLGDSPYNVEDFLAVGVRRERTGVLPPFNRLDRLLTGPADLTLLDDADRRETTWLAVGRIAPNKGHLDLFDAFAMYLDHCRADARLLVVGGEDPRLAKYNAALHERVSTLRLGSCVRFLHDVGDDMLKGAYLAADVLVSLSRHEGFCVPLIEAMALGVPVIARDAAAQAWTLDGAAILWDEPEPALVAASVERVREDATLREAMRERGFARVASAFTPAVLEQGLAAHLESLQ
jgi:glycosyltransferase involved in cell wall biosynthesis